MTAEPPGQQGGDRPGAEDPAVHVVVWADSSEARAEAEAWLASRGLGPRTEWVTSTSVSYRLNTASTDEADEAMRARPDLQWTVVAPGAPDYLIRSLTVEGPDGRIFRISDAPSATPIASVAEEIVDQYPDLPGSDRPTVVDHIGLSGERRINPDATLEEESVRDGDRLHVGFQTRAG